MSCREGKFLDLSASTWIVEDEPTGDQADLASRAVEWFTAAAVKDALSKRVTKTGKPTSATQEVMRCTECGKPIPPERLAAWPSATRCVPCENRLSRSKRRTSFF